MIDYQSSGSFLLILVGWLYGNEVSDAEQQRLVVQTTRQKKRANCKNSALIFFSYPIMYQRKIRLFYISLVPGL